MDWIHTLKKRRWEILGVVLCIAFGIFLRAYHFSDWLHFEIDQSYDTLLVSPAVEHGIEELPLLGPTAGGGRALRLGPAFYYMEYASAKLFGNTPPGHAALVLILSILSLPLFYFFCRIYFSKTLSLGLLLLYVLSLYAVIYSRFSWSPNVLPFFTLLFFYALLKSFSDKEPRRDIWFIVAALVLVITTQIHFNAFFIIPAVALALFFIRRPRFKWQTWGIVLLLAVFLYSPMVLSDIETKGENLSFFLQKFKQSGGDNKKMVEKAVQVLNYDASEYLLIITGSDHVNGKKLTGYGFSAPGSKEWKIGALLFLAVELVALLWALSREADKDKRMFLWLILCWFLLSTFYFFSVKNNSLNIYPRFFLVVLPVPFVLFGLLLEQLAAFKRLGIVVGGVLLVLAIASNGRGLRTYFMNLARVAHEPITVQTEDVFPNTARITLEQQYAITNYIKSVYQENHYPVYLKAKHEYEPIFWYHLERQGISYQAKIHGSVLYQQGNYFEVGFTGKNFPHDKRFSIAKEKDFGALTVWHLMPKSEDITALRQEAALQETPVQKEQIAQIFTWKKFFAGRQETQVEVIRSGKLEEEDKRAIEEDAQAEGLSGEEVKAEVDNGVDDLE